MLFTEKQPIVGWTDLADTINENMTPGFYLQARQTPVEHTKLPPLPRYGTPIQCTEPCSAVTNVLPLRRPERALVQSTDQAPDLLTF